MKKYNRLIARSFLLYILLALAGGIYLYRQESDKTAYYKIEINRILDSLSEEESLDKLDLRSCRYVREVTFLPVEASEDRQKTEEFYSGGSYAESRIRPWYQEDRLKGWLRFDYEMQASGGCAVVLAAELLLGALELCFLGTLFYLKYRLVQPFEKLSELPYELAKGHLKGEVKEEKNRYFGRFLWGIGQLKDTLEVTKKREMELTKEKKLLLLSLSHDIKTPLHTIKLYARALEEGLYQSEEKRHKAVIQIGRKTEEIEQYVAEIMRTSKEEILDIPVEPGEFYLSELVQKVITVYRETCRVRMTELQVGAYENRLLSGDFDRSVEVFENILENALKYGDGRRIEISFWEEDYCQLIRIYNTGTAVTDNEWNHMFESFFRGANSEGKEGSGLGLYICKEIMRKMDGEIFAKKEDGGMAFVLVFR